MDLGPYASSLGITLEKTEAGSVCRMRYSPALLGSTTLHGGTIAALLKAAAAVEARAEGPGQRAELISLTTRFLRAGRQQDTFARAFVARRGGRILNVEVAAWQDDPARPIAGALASFLLD
jgi:acyl-coenzyme A thioesterase PaaI-like protein